MKVKGNKMFWQYETVMVLCSLFVALLNYWVQVTALPFLHCITISFCGTLPISILIWIKEEKSTNEFSFSLKLWGMSILAYTLILALMLQRDSLYLPFFLFTWIPSTIPVFFVTAYAIRWIFRV